MLSRFNNILSNDGNILENLVSVASELHEILMAFGQTPFVLSSAQISSPPLIIHTNNGFESRKNGRLISACRMLRIFSTSLLYFNNKYIKI